MLKVTGTIAVTVFDLQGRVTQRKTFQNTITDLLFNKYRDALAGDLASINDLKIWGMACGTDNTPPAASDTTLGGEFFRKAITSFSKPGIGQYKTTVYLAPADAVGDIEELGWFAGPDASITPDSGLMIARVLWSRSKTALESVLIERTDSIEEA